MTPVDPPPQQNQTGNTNNRRANWILQLVFQLILARVVYSLFINSQKKIVVNDSVRYATFNNYFQPGDQFDVYGVLTNDIRIDLENIERYGKIIYKNQNKVYSHKFNNPYEATKVKIKPNDRFFNDLNENLYLAVFVIPQKSYHTKNEVFYKSKFKEGMDGHYLVKTVPLTKVKKDTRPSEVHLLSSGHNAKETGNKGFGNEKMDKYTKEKDERKTRDTLDKRGDNSSKEHNKGDGEGEDKKFWFPRLDINLVYDERDYSSMKNDIYFEGLTKHYNERLYDPVLYLSQFWVLEENMVVVEPLSGNYDGNSKEHSKGDTEGNYRQKEKQRDRKPEDAREKGEKEDYESLGARPKEPRDTEGRENLLNSVQNMNMEYGDLKLEGEDGSSMVGHMDSELSEMQLLLSKDEGLLKNLEVFPEEVVVEDRNKSLFKKFVFKKGSKNRQKDEEQGEDRKRERGERKVEEGELELLINFSTCSPMYYMMVHNMSLNHSNNFLGIDNTKELDTLKKTIMNTNIYYLVFSAVFILLHTIFSVFAFKNDIQFWYKNESMEGLSTITMFINFVSEVIIGLYVYDSEKSSFLILFEIFMSVASSFWKLTKAVKIRFVPRYPFFEVVKQSSYIENKTKEYDRVAIKYMSMLLAPCIVGYAVYSLYYQKHKSWYSYIISVLAGSVYTFGFIMMTPQLYINYKLKSVEHLPWRALIYKSLNTFVDDVASFLIDMPMLHRLSCFRDDIIFFCYLYQRWKYKVDPNRNNPNHVPEENQENRSLENEEKGEEDDNSNKNKEHSKGDGDSKGKEKEE